MEGAGVLHFGANFFYALTLTMKTLLTDTI